MSAPSLTAGPVRLFAVVVGALMTVALLQAPSSAEPRAAGSGDRLAAVSQDVRTSGVRGISWYTDAATGQVVVTADRSVSRAELATVRSEVGADDASELTIQRTKGVFRPLGAAGDAIYGSGYRCSLGFNVQKGGSYYFLTAGHCGKVVRNWYTTSSQSTLIGPTVGYSYPGNDYALVQYTNTSLPHPGGFTAANAYVGEPVTRRGSTTGTRSGTVTALNVTVRYQGGGKVSGMIQTNVCAEPGDSGGPLYDGSKAIGLTSGGSGNCTTGGTTFFQPVTEALSAYGVTIY